MKQYFKAYVEKVDEKEDGVISAAIATDGSIDRDGERIAPDGWDFTNFERNPVLLWAHDYRSEPIGKVLEIRQEGKRIIFKPQFAINISDKAKKIFEMYKTGFLNAFSVGFQPKEWHMDQSENGQTVRVFDKTELLEISAVPVPANPNAVVLARAAKADEDIIKQMESFKDPIIDKKTESDEMTAKITEQAEKIIQLKKTIAGLQNGNQPEMDHQDKKVDPVAQLLSEEGTKKLLQVMARTIGETLRRAKEAEKRA